MMLPTGTAPALTAGKFSLGPMALAFYIGKKWTIGTVVQQWWSVAGESSRATVNLTDIQYVLRYRITLVVNIGFGPSIRFNWWADHHDRVTFPIGLGADTLIRLGPLPVRVGAEFQCYPVRPEVAGPEYSLKLIFTPVIAAPEWAKRPLF
jgi:hypothetical protein